jgi:hypothetical protein
LVSTATRRQRRQLVSLYVEQDGRCWYCDGRTWLVGAESADQVRARLQIPKGVPWAAKMLRSAMATREHIVRKVDGGRDAGNLKMACHACNVRRGDSPPDVHRIDMQVLVAAGLHPTNRTALADDPRLHIKAGLKALKKLRVGEPIQGDAG